VLHDAISTTSRAGCRTLGRQLRARARTQVHGAIEHRSDIDRMRDREADINSDATSNECSGSSNVNFVRTRDVEMLDVPM
jgi:hypothetical protein